MITRERLQAIREFASRTDTIHNRQELLDLLDVIDEQQKAIDALAQALDAINELRTICQRTGVMQSFPWKTFGPVGVGNLAAPTVRVEIPGPHGPVTVEGVLDTGADVTELNISLIDILGISMNQCAPVKADGGWRPTTVVQARLDDHVFDLPVTFVDRKIGDEIINLFGRTGLLDTYRIVLDPIQQRTEFERPGNLLPSAATAAYEDSVAAWLGVNPAGFADGVEYQ